MAMSSAPAQAVRWQSLIALGGLLGLSHQAGYSLHRRGLDRAAASDSALSKGSDVAGRK